MVGGGGFFMIDYKFCVWYIEKEFLVRAKKWIVERRQG